MLGAEEARLSIAAHKESFGCLLNKSEIFKSRGSCTWQTAYQDHKQNLGSHFQRVIPDCNLDTCSPWRADKSASCAIARSALAAKCKAPPVPCLDLPMSKLQPFDTPWPVTALRTCSFAAFSEDSSQLYAP